MDDVTVAKEVARAMRAAGRDPIAARQLFPCGFTINGYDIQQIVGSGGQAHVFKAIQRSTGCAVAIKILIDGRFAESRARRRFEREAKLLASLRHPNVVSLIDQGRTSHGAHYLTMPFIEGCTFDKIFDGSRTDRKTMMLTLSKVARAVHACHEAGILHRDLKPQNILVDQYGHPHILDFGMARPFESDLANLTRPGCDVGTMLWSSPEQFDGNDAIGPETDVYSLGVLLYQCLSGGRHPFFVDGSLSRTLDRIRKGNASPPSEHSGLNEIAFRAMSKRFSDRYSSAAALADAIDSNPVANKPRRRWFWIARICGSAVVVAALASSLWVRQGVRRSIESGSGVMIPLPSITNSIGMELVRIPAGDFEMRDSGKIADQREDHQIHRVIIAKPFWIAKTETTQGQWRAVMHDGIKGDREDLPVANVTHAQVAIFCQRLSADQGRHYRLPKSSEWEYAATDGGNVKKRADGFVNVAWSATNSGNCVHPVGELAASAWGLRDVFGNVAELCTNDPEPNTTPHPGLCVCGGSFCDTTTICVQQYDAAWLPEYHRTNVGFRVVADDP